MALQAIDMHVHPSTHEWLVDGLGELKEATERHFRTEIAVRSVDEMAEEFRVDDVIAVLFGWDAETAMGLPRVPNDFIADCVRRHPDVFIGFASVDPWKGNWALDELRRAVTDLGLRGLKLHPSAQAFAPNDRHLLRPVRLGHRTRDPGGVPYGHDGFGGRLAGRAVGSSWDSRDRSCSTTSPPTSRPCRSSARTRRGRGRTRCSPSPSTRPTCGSTCRVGRLARWSPDLVRNVLGPLQDRVLFGTDYPFITFQKWIDAFRSHEPSAELEAKVLKGNAERLLGL